MRSRGRFFVASVVASLACAIAAACSFPDVEFASLNGEGGSEGGGPEGDLDSQVGPDASDDARVLLDGSDPDALIVRDAGQKVDAAGCDPTDCDCDKDGFRNTMKPGCAGGANDCDDNDTRAQPGKGYLLAPAVEPVFGDWNCSGKVELLYAENLDCTTVATGAACDNAVGFDGTVGCGKFGTVVKCKTVPVPPLNITSKCVVGTQLPNTQQACK